MATPEKRGYPFNQYDVGSDQSFKRHKPDTPKQPFVPTATYGRETVEEAIANLPQPSDCQPCLLASKDRTTGLIALLDQLLYEEAGPTADKNILHHARELRHSLFDRGSNLLPSIPRQELDKKRPVIGNNVAVPKYVEHKLEIAQRLPPLPPITEPYLEHAVFTHTSANHTNMPRRLNSDQPDQVSYERLEFLGDAYLEIMASRLIYSRFPHMEVSRQSMLRELLVRNDTLQSYSLAYRLPDRLKHGGHLHMTSTKTLIKVQADVFEAYIGALVLSDPEHGFDVAERWLTELWSPHVLSFKEAPVENARAREELNKLIMAKGIKVEYRMEKDMKMINGVQRYFMGVFLTGWGYENHHLGSGEGQNKSQACILAAMNALETNTEVIEDAHKKKLELYPPRSKVEVEETAVHKNDDEPAEPEETEEARKARKEKRRRKKELKEKAREERKH